MRPRVLVVDDEPDLGDLLARTLRRDFDVVAVTRAREALERIGRGEQFDAILCDLQMPEMTGPELVAALVAAHPALASRLITMTGGLAGPLHLDEHGGVTLPHLTKPFTSAEVRAALAATIPVAST